MKNKKRKEKHSNFEVVKKDKKKKINKRLILYIIIILVILALVFGVYTAISFNSWKNLIKDMSKNENSIIQDLDGNVIAKVGSEKAKIKVNSSDIPKNLKNAYISIEDERYYKHGGIDIKRTGAAIVSYIFHRGSSSYGGSTITQQLVKNLTGDNSSTITRKVKEWGKAISLEMFMDKDEILDLYLNVIYVGPNIYGVEAGAKYYFDKSIKNLSLEECAFLAGLNNSPNSYNPFGDTNNKEKINKRTKIVLSKMLELKYINEDEYKNAIQNVEKGLKFKKGNITTEDAIYSYHTDALINQVVEDISNKKHITKTFTTNYINMAGLTIYSNQDSQIQNEMEKEFNKSKYKLASKTGGEHSQAAMVIIDHKTGRVIGCVGGLGEKTSSRGLNRATQSVRQTGSSIKPIAVLAPGISEKAFTGATIFSDKQEMFENEYMPGNYSNYLGDVTVRRALESSQNIPFVRMIQEIKPSKSIKYLKKMGITTLTEKDNNLALALGGLDKGISPLQMAGAYATIANDGIYIEPTFYSKVENSSSKIIIKSKQHKKRVFSKEVAYILKDLLTQPVKGSHGTATYCSISGIDVAAKTGTTDENYDRWLCGFTPYFTGVTWYGYDKNETILYNGKKNPAGIMWANIMAKIHSKLPNAKFEKPKYVVKANICADTGKKANTGCTHVYEEYFLFGTTPGNCTKHSGSELKDTQNTNKNNTTKVNITDSFDTTTSDDLDAQPNRNEIVENNTNTNKTNNYKNEIKTNNTVNENNQDNKPNNNNNNDNNKDKNNNTSVKNTTSSENSNINKNVNNSSIE